MNAIIEALISEINIVYIIILVIIFGKLKIRLINNNIKQQPIIYNESIDTF